MTTKRKAMRAFRKIAKTAGQPVMAHKLDKWSKRPRRAVQQIAVPTGRARYGQDHMQDRT